MRSFTSMGHLCELLYTGSYNGIPATVSLYDKQVKYRIMDTYVRKFGNAC